MSYVSRGVASISRINVFFIVKLVLGDYSHRLIKG